MSDQYNKNNEYEQQAKQSGQNFRNQALNAGYDYFRSLNGNPTLSAAGGAAQNAANGASGVSGAALQGTAATASNVAVGDAVVGAGAAAGTAVETGAATGAAAAAGAPTGGTGTIAVLAMTAMKAGADRVKAEVEGADIGESHGSFLIVIAIGSFVILCCILLLLPSCAMFFPQLMERDSAKGPVQQETFAGSAPFRLFNAHSDKSEFFREVLGVDSYNIAADSIVREYRQIDNTNIDIYKSIIDHAIWNAFNKHALSYCTDYDLLETLDLIADKDMTFEDKIGYILFFDSEAALENYRSKPYPYTAAHENGFYYTIGDYLDGEIPDDEINNLINYAEIITVLSQSEDCAADSFSYSTFYDMLTSEQAEVLLFEIKFDKERTWSHEVIEEVTGESDHVNADTIDKPVNIPSMPDKAEDIDISENTDDQDTNITVEPVTQPQRTPVPQPSHSQAPSSSEPRPANGKSDNGDRGKNLIEDDPPSKATSGNTSKNPGQGHGKNASHGASITVIPAENIPPKYMAYSRKIFRVVLPSGDMIGGAAIQPTPSPSPTPTPAPQSTPPTPIPPETDSNTDPDEGNSLAEEITSYLVYKYGFYYDCEIAPYGLMELYTIAETDPTEMNANEYTMRNIDVLDISENWLRSKITDTSLGVDERSPMQYLDSDLVSKGIEGLFSNSIYYKNAVGLRDQLACDYIPDGQSVILDMQGYINQGKYPDNYRGTDGRGQSIKAAGCCDCSYVMIAMYLNRANYNITSISRKYVSNNNFRGTDFLNSVGLKEDVRDAAYSAGTIIGYLTEGLPVMLHISGRWTYNGITYHSSTNGHFLVIMGFDDVGFYVYDPGSNRNTTSGPIPYAAFSHVAGKSIRVISRNSTFRPHYLVNTYVD